MDHPEEAISRVAQSLKAEGILTLSSMLPSGGAEKLYNHVRTDLEDQGKFEALKYQFDHVCEFDHKLMSKRRHQLYSREDLRAMLIQSGFVIIEESSGFLDGHTLFLKERKRRI